MWQAQNVTPLPPAPSLQDARCLRLRNCVQHVFWPVAIDFSKGEESLSALCFVKNYPCSMMMRLSPVLKDLIFKQHQEQQKAAVVAAAIKLRLQVCRSLSPYPQKWLLYGVAKLDQSLVLLFEDFYIRTENTVLQLQLAPANDAWVGFAIIKYQIACKGIK